MEDDYSFRTCVMTRRELAAPHESSDGQKFQSMKTWDEADGIFRNVQLCCVR